jgi:hypothetical protein
MEQASTLVEDAQAELSSEIMEQVSTWPEGTPLRADALEYLGSIEAVSEAMSDLAVRGKLNRVCEGIYVQPIETRFGTHSPDFDKVIPNLAELWGETIVPCGGASANILGMTTQVPVRPVYLTSGTDRTLNFGKLSVELQHAHEWQLIGPNHKAGDAVRALAWLGPEEIEDSIGIIEQVLPIEDLQKVTESCNAVPEWITSAVNARAAIA